jgi:FkbM family methyltransferase
MSKSSPAPHPLLRAIKPLFPARARLALRRLAWRIRSYARISRELGMRAALELFQAERVLRGENRRLSGGKGIVEALVRGYPYPFRYRPGTSDILVIRNILYNGEYECLSEEKDVKLIIDLGANIGCASFYFLSKYPDAHVIAVEPDEGNFDVCRQNLQHFGGRVTLVHAGVWSSDTGLRIERGGYRDGLEWSHQVRPCRDGEPPDVNALSLATLLEARPGELIDILKVDIERAECDLFARNYERWLSITRTLVIEIHDEECERVVFKALSDYPHRVARVGGLTLCRGMSGGKGKGS